MSRKTNCSPLAQLSRKRAREEDDEEEESKKSPRLAKSLKSPSDKACPICLNAITDRAQADACRHEFCRTCLVEWSGNHNRCPMCRQIYHNVLHNFKSDTEYEEMPVAEPPAEISPPEIALMILFLVQLRTLVAEALMHRIEVRRRIDEVHDDMGLASEEQQEELQQELDEFEELLERLNQVIDNGNNMRNAILAELTNQGIRIHMIQFAGFQWRALQGNAPSERGPPTSPGPSRPPTPGPPRGGTNTRRSRRRRRRR